MKIHINDSSTTKEIKEKFSRVYPYLKLEFFNKPHGEKEASVKEDLIKGDKTIGEIRTKRNEGDLIIHPTTKAGELEQAFEDKFGIHVQVFRKSGRIWLETTSTDNWTLKEQNEVGMEMES